ncbi:type IV pilin [Halorussus halophilus]|uniref:type IV pilin n=1 Tax=Halorussus halophilus TaxID=2650975 RepID=UPI001300F261|nr:type IV pilin [Halorussus halophilus]
MGPSNLIERLREREPLRDDRATSPTIGAVLLVAVTVLLATTAGAGMFSLAQSQQVAFATATVDHDPGEDRVSVTWVANADAEQLWVKILVGDESRTVTLNAVGDKVVVDEDGVRVSQSKVVTWNHPTVSDGDEVTVTVVARKGGESVVLSEQTARI